MLWKMKKKGLSWSVSREDGMCTCVEDDVIDEENDNRMYRSGKKDSKENKR